MLQTAAFVSTLFHGPGNADKMTVALTMALRDALNNSFPGVLRLGYFSDGANLS